MESLQRTVYINQKDPGYEANVRFSVHLTVTVIHLTSIPSAQKTYV